MRASAKGRSEVLSAIGFVFELIKLLVERMRHVGADDEALKRLVRPTCKSLIAQIVHLIINGVPFDPPVWKTIHRGMSRSGDQAREFLQNAGVVVDHLESYFSTAKFGLPGSSSVELVCATSEELGFSQTTRYEHIIEAIESRGYELCEPEDLIPIRLASLNETGNKPLWLATKPMVEAGHGRGGEYIVGLGRYDEQSDKKCWVGKCWFYLDGISPECVFVFRKPNPITS